MPEKIMAVVPAYNEERTIGAVVNDLIRHSIQVIVVDDGSDDNTYKRALASGAVTLRHIVNLGQGAALSTGIKRALLMGGDIIVTFDADGQCRASDIDNLVSPILSEKADIVLGSRFLKENKIPFSRYLLLKLAILYTRFTTGLKLTDTHNGLRAFSRHVAEALSLTQPRMAHASEILKKIALNKWSFVEAPTTILYTPYSLSKGQSGWHGFKILFDLWFRK